jgi:hypothetical protein
MSNKPNKIIHEVLNIKNNARIKVRPLLDYVLFLTVLYNNNIVFSLMIDSSPSLIKQQTVWSQGSSKYQNQKKCTR